MSKRIILCLLTICLVGLPGFATTKTVGKSGAQFTSIQAAIDSFTEAEITDGEPDMVEIIDGEEYDEQVMIGRLIADPDLNAPSAGYLDSVIELAGQRDAFTLRGADPSNRPKINPVSPIAKSYGVFTNAPDDNFIATFSYFGKNITVENVEILQSSVLDEDQYGMNGQAGEMVFNNVLFAHSGDVRPGEALINFNNAHDIADKGFDNSYTFNNCTFDAALSGNRNDAVDTIYYHGMTASDASADGVDINDIPLVATFDGCQFLNGEVAMIIRGRDQENHITVKNSFIYNNKEGLIATGKGSFTVDSCIFYQNSNQPGDFEDDVAPLITKERSQFVPELTVQNSLFVENLNEDEVGEFGINSKVGSILVQNGNNNTTEVVIEKCTFVDNPIAIRFDDTSGRERSATINNCIFQGSKIVFTADSYFTSSDFDDGAVDNAMAEGSNNVFDSNMTVVEEQDSLPNVNITGEESTVTFSNPSINMDDPFAGPPYLVDSGAPAGVGADLSSSTIIESYMLFE